MTLNKEAKAKPNNLLKTMKAFINGFSQCLIHVAVGLFERIFKITANYFNTLALNTTDGTLKFQQLKM